MKKDDNVRLLFSTAIIASLFGYTQVYKQLGDSIGHTPTLYGLIVLSLAGFFSLLFLLLSANELRYEDPQRWPFSKYSDRHIKATTWLKKFSYDFSIDAFVIGPVAVIAAYATTRVFTSGIDFSYLNIILVFMTVIFIGVLASLSSYVLQGIYLLDKFGERAEDSYLMRLLVIIALIASGIALAVTGHITVIGVGILVVFLIILMFRTQRDMVKEKLLKRRK